MHISNSAEASRASIRINTYIDDIDYEIDPDAVDFEPLLVSGGTGKILSYHSESHVEEILATRNSSNGNEESSEYSNDYAMSIEGKQTDHKRQNPASHIFVRLTLPLILAFVLLKGLLWVDINKTPYHMQSTIVKIGSGVNTALYDVGPVDDIDPIVRNRVVSVDVAIHNLQSNLMTSNIVIWEPFLGHYGVSTNQMRNPSMVVASHCFNQAVYEFQMDKVSGLYQMHPRDPKSAKTIPNMPSSRMPSLPMALFTPSFHSAAITLSDELHIEGVFFAFLHSPTDIYVDKYFSMKSQRSLSEVNGTYKNDNLLVRYMNGSNTDGRDVDDSDLEQAKKLLRAKFFVITCEYPHRSYSRLASFKAEKKFDSHNYTSGINNVDAPWIGLNVDHDQVCEAKKVKWTEECTKMKQKWSRNRSRLEPRFLKEIETTNRYDVKLYEYAKELFVEQGAFFQ
ncbi:hypothetical protein ACHAXS_003006 [Conticribra weissflogii]